MNEKRKGMEASTNATTRLAGLSIPGREEPDENEFLDRLVLDTGS